METNEKFYRQGNHDGRSASRQASPGRVIIGIILVLAGFLLVLRNAGFFPDFIDDVVFSWPMLLIAIGLVITAGSSGNKTAGIIIMGVGAFFLIPIVFRETFHMYNMFWPSIFIILGIILIFSRRSRWHHSGKIQEMGEEVIDLIYVFSGGERQIVTENFRGGKITAVFGGAEIDLTKSSLSPGMNVLEIACVFGGITVVVPDEWDVKIEVTPVLGGFGDERKLRPGRISEPGKQLVIKGAVVLGGGEVKSL